MSESNNKAIDAVYEDALKLSTEERELLVVMLEQHDASGWASPEFEQAWMDEVLRRDQLFRAGKSQLIDANQVIREAWQIIENDCPL